MKPVHYLGMVYKKFKQVLIQRSCFGVETGMVETLRFLRMNAIHEYNHTMGGVDLVDQLCWTYRIDNEICNKKVGGLFYFG